MIPFAYSRRNLLAHRSTSVASVFGIGLVVFVLASSRMLVHGLEQTMKRTGRDDHAIVLRKGATAELMSFFSHELAQQVGAAPGVKRGPDGEPLVVAELLVVAPLERTGSPGQMSSIPVRGVPSNVLAVRRDVKIIEGRAMRPGTDEVMIGKSIRNSYRGIALGRSFVLSKHRKATVVGIFSDAGSAFESEIWADIETVRASYARPNLVASVTAELRSAAAFDSFSHAIRSNTASAQLSAFRQSEYFAGQSEGLAKFVGGLGAVIVLFLSIGATMGALITMHAAVSGRAAEIGTLRALGFSRLSVLASFLLESCLLALIGGGLGVLAALGMGLVQVSLTNPKNFAEITFSFCPSLPILVTSLIAGGLLGIAGGFLPAVRAATMSPLDALRE